MNIRSAPKLLLADDSATIRTVVEMTFAGEGIEVTTTPDALSAMQKFVEIQPDIVLVDTDLAGTSGYQICEMIKADENTQHLPVLLLVGSFEPFDQEEAARVGADGFLTKPFKSKQELVERVKDLLGMSGLAGTEAGEDMLNSEMKTRASGAESDDIENLYSSSFTATAENEEFDSIGDLFPDSGLDDELIETRYVADDFREFIQPSKSEVAEPDVFDWSPAANVTDEQKVPQQPAETLEAAESVLNDVDSSDVAPPADPSPELIALITERVIERMSDRVIREIAVEAVPRIANKLIREALDDEKKA